MIQLVYWLRHHLASKLIDLHYKPTIVFSEKDGFLTGSARSIKDFNIYDAILSCEDLCIFHNTHQRNVSSFEIESYS